MLLELLLLFLIPVGLVVGVCVLVIDCMAKRGLGKGLKIIVAPWVLMGVFIMLRPEIDGWSLEIENASEAWRR